MDIKICCHCKTPVLPTADDKCPSCGRQLNLTQDAVNAKVERARETKICPSRSLEEKMTQEAAKRGWKQKQRKENQQRLFALLLNLFGATVVFGFLFVAYFYIREDMPVSEAFSLVLRRWWICLLFAIAWIVYRAYERLLSLEWPK